MSKIENQEKIKAAFCDETLRNHSKYDLRGMMFGFCAANPDVIGCCTIEDAMGFADWLVTRKVSPIGDGLWEDSFDQPEGILAMRTTNKLFQIYQQHLKTKQYEATNTLPVPSN
jgi:hypothetical protein